MNRKQAVVAGVAVIIGFILGFFTAQIGHRRSVPPRPLSQSPSEIPENHPTAAMVKRLEGLQQQARAEPSNRAVRVELGNAYYDMGRFDAAVNWYEEALALEGSDPNVNTDLGTARLYLGEVEQAIEIYRRSLEIEPGHPQTLQNLGIAHFASGRYREAIGHWRELLKKHPEYPHADAIRDQIASALDRASQSGQP